MATPRTSRLIALIVAASAGFASGVIGTEATFGKLRADSGPLLYSIEVRDQEGALLASPLLVGEEGAGVHLSLAQGAGANQAPGAAAPLPDGATAALDALPPLQMSLDLSPQPANESGVCLGYRLSVDDGARHQGALHEGSISLALGQPRSVELFNGGEHLKLKLTVARAGSKAFEQLLRKHRARPLT